MSSLIASRATQPIVRSSSWKMPVLGLLSMIAVAGSLPLSLAAISVFSHASNHSSGSALSELGEHSPMDAYLGIGGTVFLLGSVALGIRSKNPL